MGYVYRLAVCVRGHDRNAMLHLNLSLIYNVNIIWMYFLIINPKTLPPLIGQRNTPRLQTGVLN